MKKIYFWTAVTLLIISTYSFVRSDTTSTYDRKNWIHWIDADRDGVNTRQEVLIEESNPDSLVIISISDKKN